MHSSDSLAFYQLLMIATEQSVKVSPGLVARVMACMEDVTGLAEGTAFAEITADAFREFAAVQERLSGL